MIGPFNGEHMSFRNLSPQQMFIQIAREHVPEFRFCGTTVAEFTQWHDAARPRVLATLGDRPETVPADAALLAEWETDSLRHQRWLLNVSKHIAATCLINIPKTSGDTPRPTLLCCHGHGAFGKEPVMGNDTTPELRAAIAMHGYDYGAKMARQHDYVTFAIDWIGFGERNDNQKPNFHNHDDGRDWCNIYYLHATMLGMTPLSINLTHGKAATDFVSTLPFVDRNRLGVMGLSGGGTMALWLALTDDRFKATEIIGYSDLWAYFGLRDINYCGMQITPGLYKLVDLPELQGLLAPRPLLIDIGANDSCFKVDSAMACYRQLERIYSAAGAPERLWLDLHGGGHEWAGNRSAEFFGANL